MALKEQDVVLYSTDTNGDKVIQMPITRIENVEGAIKTINGIAPDSNGEVSVTDSSKIAISGSRGSLAGYQSVYQYSGSITIDQSSSDSIQSAYAITVSNGTSGTSWTKIVRVTSAVTVTLGSSWKWQGGSVPTIVSGGILVCCWCGNGGVATFVSPS